VRAGQTLTVEVRANDPAAGAPSLDLTGRERSLVIKPPRVATGMNVFQRAVYYKDRTEVVLEARTPGAAIHYTLDGSEPTVQSPVYAGPVTLTRSATVRALAVEHGRQSVASPAVRFERLSGIGDVDVRPEPAPEYAGHGVLTLVDGKRGRVNALGDDWLGFEGQDVEAVIDLGETRPVKTITAGFLNDQRRWIFLPASVEYSLGSTRENMRVVFTKSLPTVQSDQTTVEEVSGTIAPVKARFVRVRAKSIGTCPSWHAGAGGKAWIFIDEVGVK
jgi:hypothetical protein